MTQPDREQFDANKIRERKCDHIDPATKPRMFNPKRPVRVRVEELSLPANCVNAFLVLLSSVVSDEKLIGDSTIIVERGIGLLMSSTYHMPIRNEYGTPL